MNINQKHKEFIEKNAKKPYGKRGIKLYNNPKRHFKSFRIIMDKLQLNSNDNFFEIGCGGGILLKQALERVKSAKAIDHSKDMVNLSSKNNIEAIYSGRLEITQSDAQKLPWNDNCFTCGANANMFFFIDKPQQALNEIYRVLKPGGRYVFVTESKNLLLELTFGTFYSLNTYSDNEMTSMLKKANFENIEVKTKSGIYQICSATKPSFQ